MQTNRHTVLLAVAGLCLSLSSAHAQTQTPSLSDLIKSIPAGTGYAAWDICSRGIAVGDDVDKVKTQYTVPMVQPLPSFWFVKDTDSKVDVSAVFLYPRRAIYRKGLGCTLITSNSLLKEMSVRAQAFKAVTLPAANPAKPWPQGEGAAQISALSTDRRAVLANAAATMFAEASTDPAKKVNTNALLVAQDGQLVYEQYSPSFNRERLQLGWSMTKTVTGLVAGLMERDGRIGLDSPVGLSHWKGTDKAAISWRHLLNMAPGLQWVEGAYGIGEDDTTKMLFSTEDQCAWAAEKPLVATPGTVYNYSTGFSILAMCRLKELAGGTHQNIYDYYQRRLFAPLGIRGGYIEPDAAGTPVGGARGMLRPVDWLRLGQLVANGGRWNGQTLLNPAYIQFMVTPSPAYAGYGGTMWHPTTEHLPEDLRGKLPADLVYFAGFQEQHVVVVPSRQLVVLRQGVAFDSDAAIRQVYELVIDLLAHP